MGFSLFTDLITPTSYKLPAAPQLDITQEQVDTQKGNVAAFDAAKGLASDYNDFMRQQLSKSLNANIPGYDSITKQLSQNFQDQLAGKLSTSDAAATQRGSAARALGLGIAGSQAGAALSARDIGLKQYQVQQTAQQQAPAWLQSMASITKGTLFDFSNVFLSPMQRAQLSWQNKTTQYNWQNLKNQMDAQPAPWEKALAGFGDSLLDAVASYYGASVGPSNSEEQAKSGRNSFGQSNNGSLDANDPGLGGQGMSTFGGGGGGGMGAAGFGF